MNSTVKYQSLENKVVLVSEGLITEGALERVITTGKLKPKGKRGRKPTSKIVSIKPEKKASDNLIAHLPLDEETIKKFMEEDDSESEIKNNKKIDIFFEKNSTNKKNNELLVLKDENKKLKKQIDILKKENGIKDNKVFKTDVNFYNETFKWQ